MSNPYGFRYPQTHRLTMDDLKTHFRKVRLPRPEGGFREVEMPGEGYEQKAAELLRQLHQLHRGDFGRPGGRRGPAGGSGLAKRPGAEAPLLRREPGFRLPGPYRQNHGRRELGGPGCAVSLINRPAAIYRVLEPPQKRLIC